MTSKYSDQVILAIKSLRDSGKTWKEVSEIIQIQFPVENMRSENALRKVYKRYEGMEFDDEHTAKRIRENFSLKKTKAQVAKDNRLILENDMFKTNILDNMEELIRSKSFRQAKLKTPKFSDKKIDMTMECMFTDLHFGKKTNKFNAKEAKRRIKEYTRAILGEFKRNNLLYNVKDIIIFFGGDIIENSDMHGKESANSTYNTTAEQVAESIEVLFSEVVRPISEVTGVNITVPCIAGNHDRHSDKSFHKPGRSYMTYAIYRSLELLSEQSGLTNTKFIIPERVFCTLDVYGNTVLYEHLDQVKGMNRNSLQNHMTKRAAQLNKKIDYMRGGHFHEMTVFGKGKIVVNGSLPGQDDYSETLGFASDATQVINFYLNSKRKDKFYLSFPVHLD